MDHFLGLYPRLVWFAPLVLGRGGGRPIRTSYCNRINGMMPGFQPLRCFDGPFPGAVPQAGMVRTFGAGEGGRWPICRESMFVG